MLVPLRQAKANLCNANVQFLITTTKTLTLNQPNFIAIKQSLWRCVHT